jgi:F420-non-reducing hydrogenase small subunit
MPDKPKIALYWCASCGGCEEAVVDLDEALLDVTAKVDLAFWPVALDYKRKNVEELADGALLASLINGGIRNSEQEEMARLLRAKSQNVIAFGSCAQLGGIPGLANLFSETEIVEAAYLREPTAVGNSVIPCVSSMDGAHALELPEFQPMLRTLDQVIAVDYYIPGCPPSRELITTALQALLSGTLPAKGSVLAPDVALCEKCPRKETKPERLELDTLRRPHEIEIDPEKCLLAQGLLCLGASTRAGCDAVCIRGNMPCTGCFGPTSRVRDQGAKAASALASVIAATDEDEIDRILGGIPDPIGTLYRYSLPASLLQRSARNGAK